MNYLVHKNILPLSEFLGNTKKEWLPFSVEMNYATEKLNGHIKIIKIKYKERILLNLHFNLDMYWRFKQMGRKLYTNLCHNSCME